MLTTFLLLLLFFSPPYSYLLRSIRFLRAFVASALPESTTSPLSHLHATLILGKRLDLQVPLPANSLTGADPNDVDAPVPNTGLSASTQNESGGRSATTSPFTTPPRINNQTPSLPPSPSHSHRVVSPVLFYPHPLSLTRVDHPQGVRTRNLLDQLRPPTTSPSRLIAHDNKNSNTSSPTLLPLSVTSAPTSPVYNSNNLGTRVELQSLPNSPQFASSSASKSSSSSSSNIFDVNLLLPGIPQSTNTSPLITPVSSITPTTTSPSPHLRITSTMASPTSSNLPLMMLADQSPPRLQSHDGVTITKQLGSIPSSSSSSFPPSQADSSSNSSPLQYPASDRDTSGVGQPTSYPLVSGPPPSVPDWTHDYPDSTIYLEVSPLTLLYLMTSNTNVLC